MTWLIFALLACVASCAAIEIARQSKINAYEIILYRCVISGFLLLPFVMYMDWPVDARFYFMMAAISIVFAWGHIVLADLAMRKNGRVAAMYQPLMIITTFIGWIIVYPDQWNAIMAAPEKLGLTLLCFAVLGVSLHVIRRNDYAWPAFRAVAPIAVGFGLLYVAQGWFLHGPAGSLGLILAILAMGNFGMVAALPLLSRYRVTTDYLDITRFHRFPVATLGVIAICHLLAWGFLLYAIGLASSPAYPVAIMALTPVVFQVYYWILGRRDQASPWAGFAMALAALGLAILHG